MEVYSAVTSSLKLVLFNPVGDLLGHGSWKLIVIHPPRDCGPFCRVTSIVSILFPVLPLVWPFRTCSLFSEQIDFPLCIFIFHCVNECQQLFYFKMTQDLNPSKIDKLVEWCLKRRVRPWIKPSQLHRVSMTTLWVAATHPIPSHRQVNGNTKTYQEGGVGRE